jgi:hypothetical protein
MKRRIASFHQDKIGDWVADLDCRHTRHVRHNPPSTSRKWVLSPEGRKRHIGVELDCKLCDEIMNQEGNIEDYLSKQNRLRIAEATRGACLKVAIEAYEDAKIRGVCQEGAWDLAVDSMKSLNVEQVLESLPD